MTVSLPPAFKNILIVRTDRIGDVVLTTPLLAALRRAFPDARITILVNRKTRDLVEGNPHVDEVLTDDRRGWLRDGMEFWRLVRCLRARRFDLVLNLHTKRRTNLLCFLGGIPRRVGWRGKGKYGFLLTDHRPDDRAAGERHESDYVFDLLRGLGIDATEKAFFIPITKAARSWADGLWRDHEWQNRKVVAVHAGASCPSKLWPVEAFLQVIRAVLSYPQVRVVLVGGPDTVETARRIVSGCAGVVDLTGQTTLIQLAAFLERAAVLVSNDSGPVHLADALGTPVVSIFTRNHPGINPERWRPLGAHSCVVAPETGVGSTDREPDGAPEGVSPQTVQRAVLAICQGEGAADR